MALAEDLVVPGGPAALVVARVVEAAKVAVKVEPVVALVAGKAAKVEQAADLAELKAEPVEPVADLAAVRVVPVGALAEVKVEPAVVKVAAAEPVVAKVVAVAKAEPAEALAVARVDLEVALEDLEVQEARVALAASAAKAWTLSSENRSRRRSKRFCLRISTLAIVNSRSSSKARKHWSIPRWPSR